MAKTFVNVTNGNGKLGQAIASINLCRKSCNPNAPCFKCGCYGNTGRWLFPNVQASLQQNFDAYQNNPKLYFDTVATLTNLNKFVRWHSVGDIVDGNYLAGMCQVARKNKTTKYLCFTKKFDIVNNFLASGKKIPKNLSIVFSAWGDFIPQNPYNLPIAWVQGVGNDKAIPQDAIPCGGKCSSCQACWQLKSGQNIYFKKH